MRKALLGLVASGAVVACGVFGSSSDDPPAAQPDGAAPAPTTPADNAKPPSVGGPAVTGLYVSSSLGADDNTGTADRPVKTLAKAFALAKQQGLHVNACAEEYPEAVVLLDGVSAFGYYDCKQKPWVRGTVNAIVRSPSTPAMLAKGIKLETRIAGFEVRSPDLDGVLATDMVGTAIALEVRETTGLTVSDSLLHAGKGSPGADGTDGPTNSRDAVAITGTAGVDEHAVGCVPSMILDCTNQTVRGSAGGVGSCTIGAAGGAGGEGGQGRWYYDSMGGTSPQSESLGPYDARGLPVAANTNTAVGGLNLDANGYGYGLPGSPGAAGTDGTDGANGTWSLTSAGFARGNGTQGGPGNPGQGGGGGGGTRYFYSAGGGSSSLPTGSSYYKTATGGGGGAGGCGGQPGTPATGGGASIGALVIESVTTFDATHIESSAGGKAGKGNLGTAGRGGGGGGGGTVHTVATTGAGGTGGPGGYGGASGHGAPGPTIAIAFFKTKPTLTPTVVLASAAADPGQPLLTGAGGKTLPAIYGQISLEYEIQTP